MGRTIWEQQEHVVSRIYHTERKVAFQDRQGQWHEGDIAQARAHLCPLARVETTMEVKRGKHVFTGRILTAENVTESTKERLKQVLAPVVALGLPVIGVISDAQPTELQAVADLWPGTAHQICQFHAIREAGRLIFVLDQRTKTDMRIRMQQKTHEYRQNMHKRVREAREKRDQTEQAIAQLEVLEEYAAMVE